MGADQQSSFDFTVQRKIWSVSALITQVKQGLERQFFDIWVEGEISNLHHSSAQHYYFTLKDANAQLRTVVFGSSARYLKFRPQNGLQVVVRGRVSLYEARGDLQCYAEYLEPKGRGSLQLAFEPLKEKLSAEGRFERSRKRPLPVLPRRIGLITSPRGAVVADIVRLLRRRFSNMNVLLYPVQVQGETAALEICDALRFFGRSHAADVLILARGGGSIEDLWPFNEEIVARAIVASPIPVISAVGHETDYTIADFVADLRAPTPSAAAELVVRSREDLLADLSERRRRMLQALRYRLLRRRQSLADLTRHRAFESVRNRLRQNMQRVDELSFRLRHAIRRQLSAKQRRLDVAGTRIRHHDVRATLRAIRDALNARNTAMANAYRMELLQRRNRIDTLVGILRERNPLSILSRGYTLVYDAAGNLAHTPSAFNPGDTVHVQFASGWLRGEVREREMQPFEPGKRQRSE